MRAYRDNARIDLALRLYQEPLIGRIARLGAAHRDTLVSVRNLTSAYLAFRSEHTGTEPLLLKGYQRMKNREKTIPPQGLFRIPEALDRLIELYAATNKPDEVKKYQELWTKYPPNKTP